MAELLVWNRREFTGAVVSGVGAAMTGGAAPESRPNIVFICSDQHIGSVLGVEGHLIVRTPNLDRLAGMGVRYRNAYCNSPLCAPARSALLSGMFPSDVGSYCNATAFDNRSPSWSNRLRDAGYYCWATGKLDTVEFDHGFQEVKTSHGHSGAPDLACLLRSPVCFLPSARQQVDGFYVDKEHADEALFERAGAFLRDQAPHLGKPWAMYLGPHQPHPKWVAKPKYEQIYPPAKMPLPAIPAGYLERRHTAFNIQANYRNVSNPVPLEHVRRARSAYFGMVTELDALIGKLMDQLERTNQMRNTIIVYTTDHGEMLGEHGLWSKNVLLENAAHIPMIFAGPGLPRGKVVDTPVSHVDMVATMLELADVPRPSTLRGHSLVSGAHPGFTYSESHSDGNHTGSFMIRKGEWKYIYFTGDTTLLFNLKQDPGEFTNLSGDRKYADIMRELHGHLTSLVDPDVVTRQAFDEQERRLAMLVARLKPPEFYDMAQARLGPGQSRTLTDRLYKRKKA